VSCENINYRKTKSGLLYKIFPGKGKDSLVKVGQMAKFNFVYKFNDSVIYDSHGKMPGYAKVEEMLQGTYDLREIIPLMKEGDSAVTVQMADTLMKFGAQLPPDTKKGDRFITTMRIVKVFPSDSIGLADVRIEEEKDMPRRMKEQEERMAKMMKEQEEMQKKKMEEWKKSGQVAKELKAMEDYLASKKITARKTGEGTYVNIVQQGTGPAAALNKYVTVKYTGRSLEKDSVFQSNTYSLTIGKDAVIQGWTDGLQLFNKGGKGTLYIPGFLAYGEGEGPAGKPFAPLIFDIEILEVLDKAPGQ
jgi:FKBP-type peptidyl-prolyl cis-trans isomerase